MRKFILIALLFLCGGSTLAQSSKPASEQSLKDIQGRPFRLSDYKGKVVLLNFWATWCAPCRTEIPDLIKKQKEYRDRGLRVIGITFPPESKSEVQHFVRKLRINYRIVIGTKATKANFTPSQTLPITVVIDREGNIHDVIEGTIYSDEFEEKVKPLLSEPVPRGLDTGLSAISNTNHESSASITARRPKNLRFCVP